jgi:hypothetical protein
MYLLGMGCPATCRSNIVYVPCALNFADAPSRGIPAPHTRERDGLSRRFELPRELQKAFVDVTRIETKAGRGFLTRLARFLLA